MKTVWRRQMFKRAFLIFMIVSLPVWASPIQGSRGLINVHSARVMPKGHITLYGGTKYYGKVANFGGQNKAYTLWNVQGFTSINMGINEHLEVGVTPILYQDTNSDGGNILDGQANFPDDLYISFKLGSYSALESPYIFGGMLYTRIPLAEQSNIVYENYSAGTLEFGLTGLFTYLSNITFPDEGWKYHVNLGYLNHNDVGKELTDNPDDPTSNAMSAELLFGTGMLYPAGTFDFTWEINASYFITKPPVSAYSREYVSYLTGGVIYKPYPWLTFNTGLDIRLLSGKDQSDYVETSLIKRPDFPNYPTWRATIGAKIAILPTSLYSSDEEELIRKKALERQQIMQQMMNSDSETEEAEDELNRIKSERVKLEDELERLRKLLEKEKKNK